jgi:conjugal transfer pilin signal peptidase TrbI
MQILKFFKIFIISCAIVVNSYAGINLLTDGKYCSHFRINCSESLPFYLFSASSLDKLEREVYVSLVHPLSNKPLFKQIVGLPGDLVTVENQHVFVNGKNYGYIHQISPSGSVLSAISINEIPEGFVFLHASHPKSFDSRYGEFGLVAVEQLREKLCPIF